MSIGARRLIGPVPAGAEPSTMSLDASLDEPFPIEKRSLRALALLQVKRTFELFQGADWEGVPLDEKAQKTKIACKVRG